MHLRHLSITVIALTMMGCSNADEGTPAPEETAQQSAPETDIAVDGPERRILAFGDSLFAGYDLEEQQGYPEQLEDALRERGTNARVIDA